MKWVLVFVGYKRNPKEGVKHYLNCFSWPGEWIKHRLIIPSCFNHFALSHKIAIFANFFVQNAIVFSLAWVYSKLRTWYLKNINFCAHKFSWALIFANIHFREFRELWKIREIKCSRNFQKPPLVKINVSRKLMLA